MPPTLLLIEDEVQIALLVVRGFESAGWLVRLETRGRAGLAALRGPLPDVIVLDVGLPDLSGLEVCRAIRADPRTAALPVLFLTGRNEENDRVVGLNIGADDYLGKPFGIPELLARAGALLRRVHRSEANAKRRHESGTAVEQPGEAVITCGRLAIDPGRRLVLVDAVPVELRAREFDLLFTLARMPEQVYRRSDLLRLLWGYEHSAEVLTRTVDVHVRRLRQKLGAEGWRIETVKGVGYRLTSRPEPV